MVGRWRLPAAGRGRVCRGLGGSFLILVVGLWKAKRPEQKAAPCCLVPELQRAASPGSASDPGGDPRSQGRRQGAGPHERPLREPQRFTRARISGRCAAAGEGRSLVGRRPPSSAPS